MPFLQGYSLRAGHDLLSSFKGLQAHDIKNKFGPKEQEIIGELRKLHNGELLSLCSCLERVNK